MNPSEIIEILSKYSISPTKHLGQNFLIDDRVADRQIDYAKISSNDVVLEIGPGLGVLTHRLSEKARKVVAIEADPKIASFLRTTLPSNVELIEEDALKVDLPDFDRTVSNLPYSISSPIIFKLLEHDFEKAVVMLQKEFADRMIARSNTDDYSRLSVSVYYRSECSILEKVPRSRFWPVPRVDSAIVELVPRAPPFEVKDERLFHNLVDVLFQHRRKKIGTILRMRGFISKEQRGTLPFVDQRVEVLSPEQIGTLSDAVHDLRTI